MEIRKTKTYVITVEKLVLDGTDMEVKTPYFTSSFGKNLVFSTTDYQLISPDKLVLWEEDGPQYAISGFSDTLRGWEISPIDILEVAKNFVLFEATQELSDATLKRTFKVTPISVKEDLKNYLTK